MENQTAKELINEGDEFRHSYSFSQEQVEAFAEISGDKNPIHIDEEYASKTIFKRRIMHGFLSASVFSSILGTMFPGEGTIYMKQEMRFKRPMFAGDEYDVLFTVEEVNREKHTARMTTVITDDKGKEAISGECIVMNPHRL